MSAYIQDVKLKDLPAEVRETVKRFTGAKADTKFAWYGMTAKELISKADPHNLSTAKANVKDADCKECRRHVQLKARRGSKFILIQNDRIVDGHHYLAKAMKGNVSMSLNVLDLTPARFQLAVKGRRIIKLERPINEEVEVHRGIGNRYILNRKQALVREVPRRGPIAYLANKLNPKHKYSRIAARYNAGATLMEDEIVGKVISDPVTGEINPNVLEKLHKIQSRVRTTFSSRSKGMIRFERPIGYEAGIPLTGRVARDRYVKKIRDEDLDRRDANILRSGAAGALAGALITRRGRTLTRAAAGAAAGAGGVLAIRQATKSGRDPYGERTREGKKVESLPVVAGAGVASVGAAKLVKRKFKLSASGRIISFEKPFHGYNKKRHAKTGGLNDSARKAYNRENGSNLKRPVTKDPSKLKPGSKAANRRKSFCARMSGVSGPTSKDGKLTPKGAALKRWNCESKARVILFKEKKQLNPYVGAALSGAASGALLGGVSLLRRGTSLKSAGKAIATGAGLSAAIVGGGALVGSRIVGEPRKDEGAPFTKRAAIGGGIVGAATGLTAGVVASRTKAGQRVMRGLAKQWRPAALARRGGLPVTAAIGTVAGGAVGAAQGADEGQQVDSIRNLRKDMGKKTRFSIKERRTIRFDSRQNRDRAIGAGALTAGAGVGYAGYRVAKAAKQAEAATGNVVRAQNKGIRILKSLKAQLTTFPTFKRLAKRVRFSMQGRLIQLGRSDQPRWQSGKRYADPVEGYARGMTYVNADGSQWKASSPQLANSLWRDAKKARVTVQRTGGLTRDALDELRGAPRQKDAAGRTKKREWEKSWFQNAVTTASIAGAVGGGVLLRRYARVNPTTPTARLVKKTEARVRLGRQKIENATGRAMDKIAGSLGLSSKGKIIKLDQMAEYAGWDVRDPRGRSARVFAPGSRRRMRRQAEWHEKKDGQRKLLIGAGAAATALVGAGALAAGVRMGETRAVKRIVLNRTAAAEKAVATRMARAEARKKAGNVIQAFPKKLPKSFPQPA